MFRKEAYANYCIYHDPEQADRIVMRGDTWTDYTVKEYEIYLIQREQLYNDFGQFFQCSDYRLDYGFEMGDVTVDLAGYDSDDDRFDLFRLDIDDRIKDLGHITTFDNWVTEFRDCGFDNVQCYLIRFPRCQIRQKKTESRAQYLERVRQWAYDNPPVLIPVNGYYIDGFTPF